MVRQQEAIRRLEDLRLDRMTILKWLLNKWVAECGLHFFSFEYRLVVGCCECGNEYSYSMEGREFADHVGAQRHLVQPVAAYLLVLSPCVARMTPAAPMKRPVNSSETLAMTLRPTRSISSRITQQDGRIVDEVTVNRTKGL